MKRALSIILIFIALTNIVGFMPLYFSLLQEIKEKAELEMCSGAGLQKIGITDMEYNDPALFKMTDENEFSYKGRMYDYKKLEKTNGEHIFYALPDNKETELIGFLKATFGQSNENDKCTKGPLGNLLKNFSKDFIGSFSKATVHSSASAVYSFLQPAETTSAGYFTLLPEPPDTVC